MTSKKLDAIEAIYPDLELSEFRGQKRLVVPKDQFDEVMEFLHSECNFEMLSDVTCVDYLNYRKAKHRFGLVYLLSETETVERLTVRVYLDPPDLDVSSVTPIWEGANWMEREVYDMFGIRFVGHPDLRRILMPEEFSAHPLCKDYPLQGRGERHNFPVLTRSRA